MSGNATTTAIGTVTITATSADTNAVFKNVAAAVAGLPPAAIVTYSGSGAIPAPIAPGEALILPASTGGNLAIPEGYAYVIEGSGSTATLTGGGAATTIVGNTLNYTGNAAEVASGDGSSTIVDGATGATILVGAAGRSTVTAGGANQTVHVGENGTASVLATGAGDTIVAFTGSNISIAALGDGETVSISAQSAASVTSGGNNQVIDIQAGGSAKIVTDGSGDTLNIGSGNVGSGAPAGQGARSQASAAPPVFTSVIQGQRGSSNTYNSTDAAGVNELVLGTADTVNASAGASTIFGLLADRVVASDQGQVYFVGGAGASTILGGAANATVFASTGQVFDVGAAQANVFVGGTAASTINAGTGGGSFFGGTSGDEYNIGTGVQQVFVGLGGADTLNGVAGAAAPTIFAIGAEHMTFTAATKPVTVVSFASGGVIDASSTGGNNVFFAGFGLGGNQTLIGSTQGADVFVAGANSANTPSSITIDNWHSGDVFYLGGFTAADNTTMDAAIANSLANGAKGDLSFTLSDNTKITFAGDHPTNFSGTSAF